VLHRDLKPSNVLLDAAGTLKVSDFGLAKRAGETGLTASGAVLGTPGYMAPEQAAGHGKVVGPEADIHALGAILYACLTGRPPFQGATPLETLVQVVSDEPLPPRKLRVGLPRDLEAVCLKCLSKRPQDRYASARALADDLQRFLEGRPTSARSVGLTKKAVRWLGSQVSMTMRWTLAGLVAGAAVAVLTFLPFALVGNLSDAVAFPLIAWLLTCVLAGTVLGARWGMRRQSHR
jgi:serine/threonine protein kinase